MGTEDDRKRQPDSTGMWWVTLEGQGSKTVEAVHVEVSESGEVVRILMVGTDQIYGLCDFRNDTWIGKIGCPESQGVSPLDDALKVVAVAMEAMTDEQRVDFVADRIMANYCNLCGSSTLPCYCAPAFDE